MRDLRIFALPVVAVLAALVLAPGAVPAEASIMAPFDGSQSVNVSVGFNTQVPLPDMSEETLATAQRAGREYVYRLGPRRMCAPKGDHRQDLPPDQPQHQHPDPAAQQSGPAAALHQWQRQLHH